MKWCDPMADVVAFNAKVQRGADDACWPFMGARVPAGGYGRARINKRLVAAHRIAYMLAKGNIPAGLDVMHLCDNPPCCNPEHLKAATTLENMHDAKRKGRHSHGENARAKITEAQAIEILKAKPAKVVGSKTLTEALAARHGISYGAVLCIWRGESWAHLQGRS